MAEMSIESLLTLVPLPGSKNWMEPPMREQAG